MSKKIYKTKKQRIQKRKTQKGGNNNKITLLKLLEKSGVKVDDIMIEFDKKETEKGITRYIFTESSMNLLNSLLYGFDDKDESNANGNKVDTKRDKYKDLLNNIQIKSDYPFAQHPLNTR